MKNSYSKSKIVVYLLTFCFLGFNAWGQTAEWRLVQTNFSSVDPDAGGPAHGSVQFQLQMRAQSGTITAGTISTGFSFQSYLAALPTGVTCPGSAPYQNNPPNIVLSTEFATAGYSYNAVLQCNALSETIGTETFTQRAIGTLVNGSITLTTAWTPAFTATLWTLGTSSPQGGFAMLHSGELGSPGQFTTYGITDPLGDPIPTNSLSYSIPIPLGTVGTLPVLFTNYNVNCNDKGTAISWSTATEMNSSHFEIQKNANGTWATIDKVAASGNSNEIRKYQYLDLEAGVAQYRIKQVDLDGHFVYSPVRYTSCESRKNINIVIFPIPVSDVLNVAIRTDKAIRTELQLLDMSGRIVKRQAAVLNSGNSNLSINVSNLSTGEYIIRSSDETLKLSQKFTILR
ncbi:MAG TPA: T9SS type A sorting domain-containing protein [Chitinophagaceae bacterium]